MPPAELSAENAVRWLERYTGPLNSPIVRELGGGVSNIVILVETKALRAVIKQSLGKLRVEKEWISDRDRIFREAAAMRFISGRIQGGRVPGVIAEDRENFAIAMEAAPDPAEMWKTRLFRGELEPAPARAAGRMLASLISSSWANPEGRSTFGDTTVFDQLRLDPYYRFTAARVPESAPYIARLLECSQSRSVSLTHGDWSPKNLLVADADVWAIDWEVIHFGDPSFDAGFLLNHLVLKSVALPRWKTEFEHLAEVFLEELRAGLQPPAHWIPGAALEHLPALLLARVEGKSPVEYLDEAGREYVRALALELMQHPPASVKKVFAR